MKRFQFVAVLALVLTWGANRATQAKDPELVVLTGCVQGFAQGGYFLSDTVDKKGKTKHYLLVNDNEELKNHTGRWVKVAGTPFPFGWSVKYRTEDNRLLKTGHVFGVDTVEVVQASCQEGATLAQR
jgi:hypothetical protein